jgi:hypothetical protein
MLSSLVIVTYSAEIDKHPELQANRDRRVRIIVAYTKLLWMYVPLI